MASRSILRDRQPPNTPAEDENSSPSGGARQLHMVTPAKNKFHSIFGRVDRGEKVAGNSGSSNGTPLPPPVPSIPTQHRMSTTSSNGGGGHGVPVTPFKASKTYSEHGTIIQPPNDVVPVPKIRAGMTPEARTRLMPTPKPLPPSKLRGNQTPSASSSSTAGSTMRLVQPRQSISRSQQEPFTNGSYDLPMPSHASSIGEGSYAGRDEWDALGVQQTETETGWQEIGSQSSSETVLVTIR